MNCPKCIYDDKLVNRDGSLSPKEIEMEDKGEVISDLSETDEVIRSRFIKWSIRHIYQCPVCKEIIIQ